MASVLTAACGRAGVRTAAQLGVLLYLDVTFLGLTSGHGLDFAVAEVSCCLDCTSSRLR